MNKCVRIEELLIRAASRFGDKIGIISLLENCSISFNNWLCDAILFARWINAQIGTDPGHVILQVPNSYSFACAIFGGFIAKKTIIPLNPKMDYQTLSFILKDCQPLLAIIDEKGDKRTFLENGCNTFALQQAMDDIHNFKNIEESSPQHHQSLPKNFEVGLIIYTSGSTGLPKGVVCPHRQILFTVNAISSLLCTSFEDVVLSGLPFSFDYGLYQIFLTLHCGATLVIAEDFSIPMAIPHWIDKFNVTALPGVPSLFQMLIESNLLNRARFDQLRYITSTGDVFPVEAISTLKYNIPKLSIFPMYGLTECKRVSILLPSDFEGHETSVGKPLPGTKAFVVNDYDKILPANKVGELVIQGPHVMKGYLNNPEDSSIRFKYYSSSNNPRLYTGDFFRIDNDGFLYFVARNQNFLKLHAQRISSLTLERNLSSLSDLQQVAIVGIKDQLGKDDLFVFVRPKIGKEITPQIVSKISRPLLPIPLNPRQIYIYKKTFPLTQNGKIDRKNLTKLAYRILKR